MTRNTIGGTLNLAALVALANPATAHRPDDADTLAREAHRLVGDGLSIHDVAHALKLTPAAVAQLLTPEGDEP